MISASAEENPVHAHDMHGKVIHEMIAYAAISLYDPFGGCG